MLKMATSAPPKEKSHKKSVVRQLSDLFGSVLNLQIIESVAHNCNYNVEMSSHHLLEMSCSIDESPVPNGEVEKAEKQIVKSSKVAQTIPNSASDGCLHQNLSMKQLNTTHLSKTLDSRNMKSCENSRNTKDLEKVITAISQGYRILILMRGLPGSGKSHLAKFIMDATIGRGTHKDHILSADDYFCKNGQYKFDKSKLQDAHGWNHNRAFRAMSRGVSPVIIDNTNTQMWEMKPYAVMATDYGYYVEILEPDTQWRFNAKELARKNKHSVSKQHIDDMLLRYQKNVTGYDLLCAYNLKYTKARPPVFRNQPPLTCGSNWFSCSDLNVSTIDWNNQGVLTSLNFSSPQIDQTQKISENVNLMDFNEENSNSATQTIVLTDDDDDEDDINIVDEILSCPPVNGSNILKPDLISSSTGNSPSNTGDSQLKRGCRSPIEKSLQDIETAWGINEKALYSWKIVTPLLEEDQVKDENLSEEEVIIVETKDSCSNTEGSDFHLYRREILPSGYKILYSQNRDINKNTPLKTYHTVPKKLKLDKGCYVDMETQDTVNDMEYLKTLFPSIPKKYLKEMYQKCEGNLNWAVDLLLEDNNTGIYDGEETDDDDDDNINEVATTTGETVLNTFDVDSSSRSDCHGIKNNSKKTSSTITKEAAQLKIALENKFHISNDHYSEHLLKIKHRCSINEATTEHANDSLAVESDSQLETEPLQNDTNFLWQSNPSTSRQSKDKERTFSTDSDSDIEFDTNLSENETEEIIELNLGDTLISQLEEKFENEIPGHPKGFHPVIQVPISLAKQLFALYIESAYQQMEHQNEVLEDLVKQDAEFAKKLDEQERKNVADQKEKALNFKEIIDEQVALSLYQKDVDHWKNLTPDNLAARMTRQKLFNAFPTIDQNAIVEILYAHDNNYTQTVEMLLNSAPPDCVSMSVTDVKNPPITDEIVTEMKQDVKNCCPHENNQRQSAEEYRAEAQSYLDKRTELIQKAEQYYQRGMTEVAQFYSELARKQTSFFEQANSMAAISYVEEHSKRLQSFDTLDLHFLYTREVAPVLDMFIDRNLNLLKSSDKRSQHLFIITGRGKNSDKGVSKLKPVVIQRLKKRKINYVQLNPGLLKIKITKQTPMTSDV